MDRHSLCEDPYRPGKERNGQQCPLPGSDGADFLNPFCAKHTKAVEEGVFAEIVCVEEYSTFHHCEEQGTDAVDHASPLRQAEEERRDEVIAKEDVDIPEERCFAPAGVEEKVAQRVQQILPAERHLFDHASHKVHNQSDDDKPQEELLEFAPDILSVFR